MRISVASLCVAASLALAGTAFAATGDPCGCNGGARGTRVAGAGMMGGQFNESAATAYNAEADAVRSSQTFGDGGDIAAQGDTNGTCGCTP